LKYEISKDRDEILKTIRESSSDNRNILWQNKGDGRVVLDIFDFKIDPIKEIIRLNITKEPEDDIDHLGNRRVRAIGGLIQNRFRVGLARMERIIKDRMSTSDIGNLNPSKLINARPVIGVVREFFMSLSK